MRLRLLLVVAAALAAGAVGCVPDAPPRVELSARTVVPDRCGLVFWIDGLDIEHFHRLTREGKLPNIARWILDRGVTVEDAVASLPTITYANNVSFNTGLFPGHHGIVDNKWFDRRDLVFQDYGSIGTYQQVDEDFSAQTIYEVLSDDFTATILTPVRRGATRPIDNWATAGVAWYFDCQPAVNHLTTLRFELIADLANRKGVWPTFILAYFVTPDTVGHAEGPSGPGYEEMILDIDRQVGHICQSLQAAGVLEKTFVTLVSDHGFVDTPRHLDVAELFRTELKVPTISEPYGRGVPRAEREKHFGPARAVVVAGGNRRCAIHLRVDDDWAARPTSEQIDRFADRPMPYPSTDPMLLTLPGTALPELLAAREGVDLVTVRLGDDRVAVLSAGGRAEIERKLVEGRHKYSYSVVAGTDPLGYASHPRTARLSDGVHHAAGAWLWASQETDRPDAIVQLIELNDSVRNGDVALFAADGWDFVGGPRADRGGHGGLLRHEVVVPWAWAGPGLAVGKSVRGWRTVDLMPTMLDLLGRGEAIPPGLDGRTRAEGLRNAGKQ